MDPIATIAAHLREDEIPHVERMIAMTSILRAQQVVVARVTDVLRALGLSFARYEALVLLHYSPDGMLPLAKTSERLLLHPSSVTGTIDRLERDGLVERRPHPTDRRVTLAQITHAGSRLAVRAQRAVARASFGLADLSDEEVDSITQALAPLRRAAWDYQKRRGEPDVAL